MPPKKNVAPDVGDDPDALPGFTVKETKLLAAAFVSSTGPDKYDYDLLAHLSGNTVGTVKKYWPTAKKKAINAHPSFGSFLGAANDAGEVKPATKANAGKKRKTPESESEASANDTSEQETAIEPKKSTAKKRPVKKAKVAKKGIKKEEQEESDEDA